MQKLTIAEKAQNLTVRRISELEDLIHSRHNELSFDSVLERFAKEYKGLSEEEREDYVNEVLGGEDGGHTEDRYEFLSWYEETYLEESEAEKGETLFEELTQERREELVKKYHTEEKGMNEAEFEEWYETASESLEEEMAGEHSIPFFEWVYKQVTPMNRKDERLIADLSTLVESFKYDMEQIIEEVEEEGTEVGSGSWRENIKRAEYLLTIVKNRKA
jgi:hypothetical protein